MLLARGSEGGKWIRRLPGDDPSLSREEQGGKEEVLGSAQPGDWSKDEGWWADGISGASAFEQACQRAAGRIGNLFGDPRTG